jgi:hypothetical protein
VVTNLKILKRFAVNGIYTSDIDGVDDLRTAVTQLIASGTP